MYSALVAVVEKYGGFSKCSCILKHRLCGVAEKYDVDVPVLHCIIHQEFLCSNFCLMNDVMKDVTRTVNLIRCGNRAQSSAEFHDIPLHSEIRWLSVGKTLTAIFAIRKEIAEFLETAGKIEYDYLEKHKNEEWLCTLAFLTDITEHLNILNLKLQGKKQNMYQLISHIEAFRKKLRIYEEYLKEEFEKRFSDFDNMKTIFQLFADPMAVTIEDQDPELQMELCEPQSDILLSSKQNLTYGQLWNFIIPDKYPKLHNCPLKVISMFGSTYICECALSTMKRLKSKQRNRLTQEAFKSNLRIVTTEMEADIVALVKENTAQCSH
ncbi:hypothetical protein PR048_006456 [Dryococelus australis]|uniref:Uncharacterized protein n=1 Tax=Dryococelus australis TaxID=614101 RepID=A0ABQ9IB11_9NEOP|nr:hypothetical protein PR048_006456 [Dryococelus australis]